MTTEFRKQNISMVYFNSNGDRGGTAVKVLCYKSEGRWFDPNSFQSHYGPGVDSASNRNEYQEYFLGVKATGKLSCNLGTLTSWNPLGHSRPVTGLLYVLYFTSNTKFLRELAMSHSTTQHSSRCTDV